MVLSAEILYLWPMSISLPSNVHMQDEKVAVLSETAMKLVESGHYAASEIQATKDDLSSK